MIEGHDEYNLMVQCYSQLILLQTKPEGCKVRLYSHGSLNEYIIMVMFTLPLKRVHSLLNKQNLKVGPLKSLNENVSGMYCLWYYY